MCHALCFQITTMALSCVMPCVPRSQQCPSHVSCLVFPDHINVPAMCRTLCSQITAASQSCVMPFVPRSHQCPSHVLYVPRSSTSVEVWLHLAWQKRLSELPWRGEIVVTCNGKEKVGILSFLLSPVLFLSLPLLPPPLSVRWKGFNLQLVQGMVIVSAHQSLHNCYECQTKCLLVEWSVLKLGGWGGGGGPRQFLQPIELLQKSGKRQVPESGQPPIGHISHLMEERLVRR